MWLFNTQIPAKRARPQSRRSNTSMIKPNNAPPLAIELVLDILEIVHHDEIRTNGRSPSIIACATVCKTWAPIAQRLLFKKVALETLKASVTFVRAVSEDTEKAEFLRDSVRSLEVLVSDEEDGRIISQFDFARILKLCPQVRDLRLFYFCLRALDYQTLDILRTVPAPVALSVRSAQDPSPLWDLLEIWPTVEHLEVASWESPLGALTAPPTGKWSPYEVRWLDESDSGEESGALSRLMNPGSLKILQLQRSPSAQFFEETLSAHGPYLRSLRLKSLTDDMVESLKHCTSLEEFKYLDIPSLDLLQSLPPTLEHLQIQNGTANHASIDDIVEYIANAEHRLRVLTYNSCGAPKHREYMRLREACIERGITFKCYGDNAPLEEREPFIRPTRFPRTVPISPKRRTVALEDFPESRTARTRITERPASKNMPTPLRRTVQAAA